MKAIELHTGFATRLRRARRELGLTQGEMARALGIGAARYSKYEIGRSEASYEVLVKIARLTRISLDYLIAGDQVPASRGLAATTRSPIRS